jgi:TetR/AcrR family transcriptional repressor of nem operon
MARTPGSIKAETHERIVETAARAIRAHGYAGASVADVMKEAGLTHGGFYAHFASRDAMVEEAIDRAAGEGRTRLTAAAEGAEPGHALEAIVASYLSDRHVEHPESGCTLAALGSETARQAPALRRIATRQVRGLASLLAVQLPGGDTPDNRDGALALLCGMVGALSLARAVDDPALSRALRDAVARSIQRGPSRPRSPGRAGRFTPPRVASRDVVAGDTGPGDTGPADTGPIDTGGAAPSPRRRRRPR